jgi:hypothetical protein
MTYWDNKNMVYVETSELLYREIDLRTMENNPDCERNYQKDGYWVKINSLTCQRLLNNRCELLTTHYKARQ